MSKKILGTYPIDTEVNIKTANRYFNDHYKQFPLPERITFARELAPELSRIGVEPCEKVAHYSTPRLRRNYIETSIRARDYMTGGLQEDVLTEIVKVAAVSTPEDFVVLLSDFDQDNNLTHCYGHRMPDPYDSVYMTEKVAEELSGEDSWKSDTGDVMKKTKFSNWVEGADSRDQLKNQFGEDVAEGLVSNQGWDVFSSLPNPHKKIITRMVNENVINGMVSPGVSRFSVAGQEKDEELYEPASNRIKRLLEQ